MVAECQVITFRKHFVFAFYLCYFLIAEPITKAKTSISYRAIDVDLISFRGNADALVFMKSADNGSDLWYASIDGKSGFVSPSFLRETRVLEKKLVTVPLNVKTKKSQNPDVQPDKVQQAHEVIEGTTIYTTTEASSQLDSTTENPVTKPTDGLTPLLNTEEEPGKNSEQIQQSDDNANFKSENSDPIKQTTDTHLKEELHQADSTDEEKNQNSGSLKKTNQPETVDHEPKTEQNVEHANQVLPNILADALSPQDAGASSKETIEVPDLNYVQNTLNEPENKDNNELNASLPVETTESKNYNAQLGANSPKSSTANEKQTSQNINAQSVNGAKSEEVIEDVLTDMLKEELLNEDIKVKQLDIQKNVDTPAVIDHSIAKQQNEHNENDKTNIVFESQNQKITENYKEGQDAKIGQISKEIPHKPNEDLNVAVEKEPMIPETPLKALNNNNAEATNVEPNEEVNESTKKQPELTDNLLEAQIRQNNINYEETTLAKPTADLKETTQTEPVLTAALLSTQIGQNADNTNEATAKLNENTSEKPAIQLQHDIETKTESVSTDPPAIPSLPLIPDTAANVPEVPVQNPSTATLPPVFLYPKDVTKQPSSTPESTYNYHSKEPIGDDMFKYNTQEPAINEPFQYESQKPDSHGSNYYPEEPNNVLPNDNSKQVNELSAENLEEHTAEPQNENIDTQDEYSTEAPSSQEENTEGFLSSIYSTIADIWPPTTEAPPSLFNADHSKFEEQNESEEFSVMKYLMATYYSVFGANEEMKALFPSHGKCLFYINYLYLHY